MILKKLVRFGKNNGEKDTGWKMERYSQWRCLLKWMDNPNANNLSTDDHDLTTHITEGKIHYFELTCAKCLE